MERKGEGGETAGWNKMRGKPNARVLILMSFFGTFDSLLISLNGRMCFYSDNVRRK